MAKPLTIKTKKPEDVRLTVPVDEVMQGDLVRFNFFIDRVTLKALKTEALEREVSVADLVRDAIKASRSK